MGDDDVPTSTWYDHRQDKYNVNTRIMLIATVTLFSVILVVVILHMYARCVFRRRERRRVAMQFLATGVAPTHAQVSDALRVGLEPAVIASLPLIAYKRINQVDENSTSECSVCISTLEEDEMVRVLPNCKHTFHGECVDMWLSTHSTCPVCRTQVEPNLVQTDPEEANVVTTIPATAPPLNLINSLPCSEGPSEPKAQSSGIGGSISRLSSFRRMLSRDKSERRIQPEGATTDIERQ
ncbi:hypothetical protein GIB67_025485 [Kingdonia uniflora]|uniref:RING-type E3 ubiquitin transferase n=1 Tax=Kingdonia uniflora TaxID=39325 RepID=A0A7J7PE08_9MAGN|nr:hypothetical protein GIB67_025485 [Kingdonia uniflora]